MGERESVAARAVGLDLSLVSTGVATADGEFVISSKKLGIPRLNQISSEILELIETIENPLVAVEGYAMGARSSAKVYVIGELGGVVRYKLWDAGIRFIEVPPTNRAKFATGKGNASKMDVLSHVTKITGKVWEGRGSDDKMDAWVLRQMILAQFGVSEYSWSKQRLDALEKLDWSVLDD